LLIYTERLASLQVTCKDNVMNASEILKVLEIPKTNARIDTLQYLIDVNRPITIRDLRTSLPKYNESTLYRNLDKFVINKIVKKLSINSDYSHYEYQKLILSAKDEHSHHHHHIVCTVCKSIQCLDIYGLENLIIPKLKKLGFSQVNHRLEFSGICKNCSKIKK
jgi:Fur family ferric uptake transcriptional regulator